MPARHLEEVWHVDEGPGLHAEPALQGGVPGHPQEGVTVDRLHRLLLHHRPHPAHHTAPGMAKINKIFYFMSQSSGNPFLLHQHNSQKDDPYQFEQRTLR